MTLSVIEAGSYWDEGLLFPKRVISEGEAANYLAELESYETETGGPVNGKWRYKAHLVFPWINHLIRQTSVLALAKALLGDNSMVWKTHIYPKDPGDGRFISWHQDSAFGDWREGPSHPNWHREQQFKHNFWSSVGGAVIAIAIVLVPIFN